MRQNWMWIRLGVVLSFVWVVSMGVYERVHYFTVVEDRAGKREEICRNDWRSLPYASEQTCLAAVYKLANDQMDADWVTVLEKTLIPLPFAWILGAFAVAAGRWVRGASPRSALNH